VVVWPSESNATEIGHFGVEGKQEGDGLVGRFFDILKKSHEQIDDMSSTSLEGAAEDLKECYEPPQIPVEEAQIRPESRIIFYTEPRSPGADRFRFLRMRLRELWEAGNLNSLLITSPLPGDGKSTVALNLAAALAERGKRQVLLVEGDLHHPTLTQQLGIKPGPGLAECLEAGLSPLSTIRRIEPLGLYLLSSGEPHNNPTELLQSEALSGIMGELSPYFDWILIDSPPVTPLTDALSLARQTDASLLVARAGQTPREAIEHTLSLLGNEHVLGILLNGVEGLDRLYSKYYGYYGRNSSPPGAPKADKRNDTTRQQPIQPKGSDAKLRRVVIRVPRTACWGIVARVWAALVFCSSRMPFSGNTETGTIRVPELLRLT